MPRDLRLVRVAAEAERLRWQRRGRRVVVRAAFAVTAVCFALFAVATLHVVGYLALRLQFIPLAAAGIIFGVDFVLVLSFAVIAARGGADSIEREAVEVRNKALTQIGETVALLGLMRGVGKMFGARGVSVMGLAALAARLLAK